MTRLSTSLVLAAAFGCAPPPIPTTQDDTAGDAAPSIRILFPTSATAEERIYCPTLVVVVDVDNYQLVKGEDGFPDADVEGQGHWHLRDNDTYVKATESEWLEWTFEGEGDHRITTVLSTNTHTELGYSDAVEIVIRDEPDCLGARPEDTGGDGGAR